jgi:hypothetical protein
LCHNALRPLNVLRSLAANCRSSRSLAPPARPERPVAVRMMRGPLGSSQNGGQVSIVVETADGRRPLRRRPQHSSAESHACDFARAVLEATIKVER